MPWQPAHVDTAPIPPSAAKPLIHADRVAPTLTGLERLIDASPRTAGTGASGVGTAGVLTSTVLPGSLPAAAALPGYTETAMFGSDPSYAQLAAAGLAQSGAAPATTVSAAMLPMAARPDIASISLRIAQSARDGKQQFEIALDPPELGRIDVKLEFGRDGRVTTHLMVERSDTLDALLRDSRGLERALQNQGLKLDEGGLQYHLRDQSAFAQHQDGQPSDGQGPSGEAGADDREDEPLAGTEPPEPGRAVALRGLDLTI